MEVSLLGTRTLCLFWLVTVFLLYNFYRYNKLQGQGRENDTPLSYPPTLTKFGVGRDILSFLPFLSLFVALSWIACQVILG